MEDPEVESTATMVSWSGVVGGSIVNGVGRINDSPIALGLRTAANAADVTQAACCCMVTRRRHPRATRVWTGPKRRLLDRDRWSIVLVCEAALRVR